MTIKKFVREKKEIVAGVGVVLLFGGVMLAGVLSQGKPTAVTTRVESTTVVNSSKSANEVEAESKAMSLLSEDVKTAEQVAVIEKELGEVKDTAVKTQLTAKLNEAKQKVVTAETKAVAQQVAQLKADESSQPATQQPTQPQATQAPVQTQRQTQAPVQTTPAPTITTRRVVETTQATTKRYRVDQLGNSGKEFATEEEAYAWGEANMNYTNNRSFFTIPVFYSDGSVTYSVHWRR